MEWSVKFEADGSLVTILATGDVGREGFRGNVEAVLSHPARLYNTKRRMK